MPWASKSTGIQDFKILVFPVGALLILFEIMYPITAYLEMSPRGGSSEWQRWHLGVVPLWKYEHYHLPSWHMANIVVLTLSVSLWAWCIYISRKV